VQIQFEFVRDDKYDSVYHFEKEEFFDLDLDCSILKLKSGEKEFPRKLKLDSSSGKNQRSITILGHPSGTKMKRDPGVVLLLSDSPEMSKRLNYLKEWGKKYTESDVSGYEKAEIQIQEKVLFHCYFTHGASGSPGVTIKTSSDRDPVCVMMLLRGFPDFYFDMKSEEEKLGISDNLLEQGLKMSALKKLLKKKNDTLCSDLFQED